MINLKDKSELYREYVVNHKSNVERAWALFSSNDNCIAALDEIVADCNKTAHGADIVTIRVGIMNIVNVKVIKHDDSKFYDDEFGAGAAYWYAENDEARKAAEKAANDAWLLHYQRNDHHWDHWKDRKDSMPITSVLEMCMDWIAMSMAKGGTALKWFRSQEDIVLGDAQRRYVEKILEVFYENYNAKKLMNSEE